MVAFCDQRGWCAADGTTDGAPAVPPVHLRMVYFASHLYFEGLAHGTIVKYVGGIAAHWFGLLLSTPVATSAALSIVLAGINKASAAVVHSNPLSAEMLQRVVAPLRCDDHDDMCMRTAILVAWCCGWRPSQYTAAPTLQHTIRVADVWLWPFAEEGFTPEMVALWRQSSKTAPRNTEPPRASWLGSAPGTPHMCPVGHLVRYLRMRQWVATPEEPVFLLASGAALSDVAVRKFLHARERPLGLRAGYLRPQGLRSGGGTALAAAGASDRVLHMWGGWSDPAMSTSLSEAYLRDLRGHMQGYTARMLRSTVQDFSHGDPVLSMIGASTAPRLTHPAGATTRARPTLGANEDGGHEDWLL